MYAITHQGKAYGPCGVIQDVEGTPLEPEHTDAYNKALEAQELGWLKTHPDKVMLYVKHSGWTDIHGESLPHIKGHGEYWNHKCEITTWLGTVIDPSAYVGSLHRDNFGGQRAPISCKIFGVQYHGWYMESSGDYCRLRKARHN